MTKKELQVKLEKITGVTPADTLTVKQLKEALKEVIAIEDDSESEQPVKKGRKIIGSLY